jgi:hypothetical protein
VYQEDGPYYFEDARQGSLELCGWRAVPGLRGYADAHQVHEVP